MPSSIPRDPSRRSVTGEILKPSFESFRKIPENRSTRQPPMTLRQTFRSEVSFPSISRICPSRSQGARSEAFKCQLPVCATRSVPFSLREISPFLFALVGGCPSRRVISSGTIPSPMMRSDATDLCTSAISLRPTFKLSHGRSGRLALATGSALLPLCSC